MPTGRGSPALERVGKATSGSRVPFQELSAMGSLFAQGFGHWLCLSGASGKFPNLLDRPLTWKMEIIRPTSQGAEKPHSSRGQEHNRCIGNAQPACAVGVNQECLMSSPAGTTIPIRQKEGQVTARKGTLAPDLALLQALTLACALGLAFVPVATLWNACPVPRCTP